MEKDDSVYLRHALDASGRILEFLEGVSQVQFEANHLIQDGVIRHEIIGEAVKRVSIRAPFTRRFDGQMFPQ